MFVKLKFKICVFLFFSSLIPLISFAQQPLNYSNILELLKNVDDQNVIIEQIKDCKVDFEVTKEVMRKLIREGATDELLDALENNIYEGLRITYPENNAEVGAMTNIQGKSTIIPKSKHLWIFIHRQGLMVWWPQGGEVTVSEEHEWMQTVFVGQKQDIGFNFEVKATWISQQDHERMIQYLKNGEQTGNYPGIPIPDGSPSAMITIKKVSH